jgi:hypothetical protein
MGLGTFPILKNELLTSSHAEAQTQGDLEASVAPLQTQLESRIGWGRPNSELRRKEIDDFGRGAARDFCRTPERARQSHT